MWVWTPSPGQPGSWGCTSYREIFSLSVALAGLLGLSEPQSLHLYEVMLTLPGDSGAREIVVCVWQAHSLPACSSCSVGNSSPSSLPPWLLHLYFSSISCMSFHCPPSKESACSAGNPGSIPGWGRLPRRRACIVAWKIPWKEEPGGLQSMGLQRVRHDWTANTHTHTHTHTHTVSPAVSLGWVTSPSFSLPCKLFGCWRFCISLGLSWN